MQFSVWARADSPQFNDCTCKQRLLSTCMLLMPKPRPVSISNVEARRDYSYPFRLSTNHSMVSCRVSPYKQLARSQHPPRVAAKDGYKHPQLRKVGSLQSWSTCFSCISTIFWRFQCVAYHVLSFLQHEDSILESSSD